MSDQLRINYRPRPDVSLEQEAEILASVYCFLLERHAEWGTNDGSLCPARGGADETLKEEQSEKGISTQVERR